MDGRRCEALVKGLPKLWDAKQRVTQQCYAEPYMKCKWLHRVATQQNASSANSRWWAAHRRRPLATLVLQSDLGWSLHTMVHTSGRFRTRYVYTL